MQEIKRLIDIFLWDLKIQRRISENTVKSYRLDLQKFEKFLHPQTTIQQEFEYNNVIVKYISYLQKDYRDTTIARALSSCCQFLEHVFKEQFDKKIRILKPKIKIKTLYTSFLENENLEKILNSLSNSKQDIRIRAIIEVLYSTGMRVSELLNLKITDMEGIFKNKLSLITGKGDFQRYIFFSDRAIESLRLYIDHDNKFASKSNFVFYSKSGGALTRQRVFQLLKNAAFKAEVDPDIVFAHAFRHRMLTNLVRSGANLIAVQKIAGHRRINTTARYTHIEDYLYEDVAKYHPINNQINNQINNPIDKAPDKSKK